jgi:hypothetical protein
MMLPDTNALDELPGGETQGALWQGSCELPEQVYPGYDLP